MADRMQERTNGYNLGEAELAAALAAQLGYEELEPGAGVWQPRGAAKL